VPTPPGLRRQERVRARTADGTDDGDEMGKWDGRVTNHAVNGVFTTVLGTLENLPDDKMAQAPEDIDRLVQVVSHVK
jgi:hypothetical protein